MANGQKVSEVLLRYRVDSAAIKDVQQANAKLVADLNNVGSGTRELSESAKSAQAELVKLAQAGKIDASGFARASEEIAQADERLQGLNQQLEATNASLAVLGEGDEFDTLALKAKLLETEIAGVEQRLQDASSIPVESAGGGGTFSRGLQSAAGVLRDVPGAQGLAGLAKDAGDLARLGERLPALEAGISGVTQAVVTVVPPLGAVATAATAAAAPLGGVTAAIAGATAVAAPFVIAGLAIAATIKTVTDAFNAGNSAIDAAVQREREAANERVQIALDEANLSSAEIQSRVRENEIRRASLQQTLEQQQALLASIQQQYSDLGSSFNPAQRAALGEAGQQTQAFITDLQTQIDGLGHSIETDTSVIQPAIAAREAETRAIQEANTAFSQSVQQAVQRAQLLASGTSDSVDSQIAALQAERDAIAQNIGSLQSAEDINNARHRQDEIDAQTSMLQSIRPLIAAREQEQQAADDERKAVEDAARAKERIAQIEAQQAQDEKNYARQDARQAADLARQRLREDIDFATQRAKAERDFNKRQADEIKQEQADEAKTKSETLKVEADYRDKEVVRLQKFEDKLADIRQKAELDVGEAAGELDAKRVYEALLHRDQELTDAKKSNDEEAAANLKARDDRLAQLQEQLTDERAHLQQRLADERAAFQQEQADQAAAFAQRRARENEDLAIRAQREQEDRTIRRNAAEQQIKDLRDQITRETAARRTGTQNALTETQNLFNKITQMARNAAAQVPAASHPNTPVYNNPNISSGGGFGNNKSGSSTPTYNNPNIGSSGGFGNNHPPAGGSSPNKNVKAFEAGGRASGWALTGERGPELARFDSPARVFSAQDSLNLLRGNSRTVNANVNINVTGGTNPQATADAIRPVVRQEMQALIQAL